MKTEAIIASVVVVIVIVAIAIIWITYSIDQLHPGNHEQKYSMLTSSIGPSSISPHPFGCCDSNVQISVHANATYAFLISLYYGDGSLISSQYGSNVSLSTHIDLNFQDPLRIAVQSNITETVYITLDWNN